MRPRFCPYCGAELSGDREARFCYNCGREIGDVKPARRQNRGRENRERYEVMNFRDASFKEVDRWFQEVIPTIISYTGRLRCVEGLLKDEWIFSYLKIKYYPRHPEYLQGWCYAARTDGIFDSARRKCDIAILKYLDREHGEPISQPVYSEYHYTGGNGARAGCEFIFYRQIDGDAGNN